MSKALTFQEVILRLQRYWSDYGCTIWQPYSEKLGAGTMNPGTYLRVLGPEPWNVAYVEPSYRSSDGRYGENPNRMQMFHQFQVILKPDPGNPQELYLGSLEVLGIDRRQHDLRFVEDNWRQPALGAWGLGWEVWLDGQEISQYTYFQQAGGFSLEPVAVELTYGLERIAMPLQQVSSVWEIDWDGSVTYGEVLLRQEIEHCTYAFEEADVDRLTDLYNLFEAEATTCLEQGLVIPAHDYIVRCSHTFNLLDCRGAIGVTERAHYFARMRNLARQEAETYVAQREEAGYPLLKGKPVEKPAPISLSTADLSSSEAAFVLEIGTEELPAGDLDSALEQLGQAVPPLLEQARLEHGEIRVHGTPRRLAVIVEAVAPHQLDREQVVRGPPARVAFDADGNPTRAAEGFARSRGIDVSDLEVLDLEGGRYAAATICEQGRLAGEVLVEALPDLVAGITFENSMRWNASGVAFSRPIRWFVSLLGETLLPFSYAGLTSGRVSRGLRPLGSPEIEIPDASAYESLMAEHSLVLDPDQRRTMIQNQIRALATEVEGVIPGDPALLSEVTNLVEYPTALRGDFEPEYLDLPAEILVSVMKKHQRYFPLIGAPETEQAGKLLPYFIAVRNGDDENLDIVRSGNEAVIRARFADAKFFYQNDLREHLACFLPRLGTLTFQEKLGSVLDKVKRLERLAPRLGEMLDLSPAELMTVQRAANLCKADLATQMVVEMTSLQGTMGREYALRGGEPREVADAIYEHYLPRFAGDALPASLPGAIIGLADRLDSLVGLFAAGFKPSGNRDPFALRRAALGIVQVLVDVELHMDLRAAIARAADLLPLPASEAIQADVLDYVVQRLRGVLLERGLRYDVLDAVLAEQGYDPCLATQTARRLQQWVERDDWMDLLNAYARCVRLVRDQEPQHAVDPGGLVEPESSALYQALRQAQAALPAEPDIDDVLSSTQTLVPAITAFFDKVLVMAEDPALRANRLGLLSGIAALLRGLADLQKLEGF
jgi:glycyl-tRNA synthetase